jgi:hypothetical protein
MVHTTTGGGREDGRPQSGAARRKAAGHARPREKRCGGLARRRAARGKAAVWPRGSQKTPTAQREGGPPSRVGDASGEGAGKGAYAPNKGVLGAAPVKASPVLLQRRAAGGGGGALLHCRAIAAAVRRGPQPERRAPAGCVHGFLLGGSNQVWSRPASHRACWQARCVVARPACTAATRAVAAAGKGPRLRRFLRRGGRPAGRAPSGLTAAGGRERGRACGPGCTRRSRSLARCRRRALERRQGAGRCRV